MTTRRNRQTGTEVTVQFNDGEGLWETICDDHSTVCSHETRALADKFASSPLDWCEVCMGIKEAMSWNGPHSLRTQRTALGSSRIKGGGHFHGSSGRCACGEQWRINVPMSSGGEKMIEENHLAHVTKVVMLGPYYEGDDREH